MDFAFQFLRRFQPRSIFDLSLLTAALRPSGSSYRDDLIARKWHTNPSQIIDELLKDNMGYLVFQEDVTKFLQQICGLSGSEADNVRRAIGRKDKDRLDKALPKILDGYCDKSPQSQDRAEQEATTFLKIIEDASSYMFGYNHAIAYSMISYVCAYLRYHHPHEFITALLNNANNEDDTKNGSDIAMEYGIQIVPPRFGLSKDKYIFDKEKGVIAKGIASIKYMSANVANELYELASMIENFEPHEQLHGFMDLLSLLSGYTSIDTRQKDILIKIDYFSDYGNINELLCINNYFSYFKNGEMKKVNKDKLPAELYDIVDEHSTDKNAKGENLKSYTIVNMEAILRDVEDLVRSNNLADATLKEKIQYQLEFMGHIDLTTGQEADRRKLIIMDLRPLRSSKDNSIWGYAANTRSIGTGKTARLTVRQSVYKSSPIKRFDTVFATSVTKNAKGYWYLDSYKKVV